MMAGSNLAIPTPGLVAELPRRLRSHTGFAQVLAALGAERSSSIDGAWGSACALVAAELFAQAPASLVVVLTQATHVTGFIDDLGIFGQSVALPFPALESAPDELPLQDELYADRLRVLKRLLTGQTSHLVVTSIQSLLQPVADPAILQSSNRRLRCGYPIDVDDLMRWLVEHGFQVTSAVELPGEVSLRGGILDLFACDWDRPMRIELFDDQIESIRAFDVHSQRSLAQESSVEITIVRPTEALNASLADYLPANSWITFVEPEESHAQAEHYLSLVDHPERFHSYQRIRQRMAAFPHVSISGLARDPEAAHCNLRIESVGRFSGEFVKVRDELDRIGKDHEVFVVADTAAEIERLSEVLAGTGLAASGRLHFLVGSLGEGFRLVDERVLLVSGLELFQRDRVRRISRRRLGKAIDSFMELREGDLVVHLSHGIGRYRGLELLDRDEHVEEHVAIEFHGGTRIYVPASKIELVQKYVGGSKTRPSLARIGGKSWVRQKKAAEAAVIDMAAELLDLHARRLSRPGIAFPSDSEWQTEFDASFPYQETDDQLEALRAINIDMRQPRPMDRLLCGDVGFGKTELAMRAAFKAVDAGFQVAVLVPTTVLAEQHYHTFQQRMAEFPFDVGRLSRFCSTKEQRGIVDGLAHGRIDIVIGTHRLASGDVRFHNLGLVIIDEEQRFGVGVKERLKHLRATVDVLTMTATPIPRTLHMSLVGVRDISNLETPPEDRLAVETRVTRFNNELIRSAVLRELNRDGQIFFVHNRVEDIEVVAKKLRQIVPEAKIKVGHGQMNESELEQVMVDFVAHRFDLLLATTIIESGLDIPNANTMFIDEADRYGLADLHQLRGRVGRYNRRAYCYLLVDPRKHITPTAAKRLRAIEEFSEMGAGFAIAMRDLEIRGAGNLLGTQQSGHIAAVGYELYCQLLENAVRQMQHLPMRKTMQAEVDLPIRAYLPADYVGDRRAKIDLYRRLNRIPGLAALDEMVEELTDRFGPPPPVVRRLVELAHVRILADSWQIATIRTEDDYLVFDYLSRSRIDTLRQQTGNQLRVVDDRSAYLPIPQEVTETVDLLEFAKSVLRQT